jgi:hypothetical protein
MTTQRADEHTRQCSALTKAGNPCPSYALRESDPPLCWIHSKSVEERKRVSRELRAARESQDLQDALADAEVDRRRLEAQARAEAQSDETSVYTSPLPEVFDYEADIERRLEELRDKLSAERDEAGDEEWFAGRVSVHDVPGLTGGTDALTAQRIFENRMRVQRANRGVL